jgi:hypothetical protein
MVTLLSKEATRLSPGCREAGLRSRPGEGAVVSSLRPSVSFLRKQEPRLLCVCPLVSFPRKRESRGVSFPRKQQPTKETTGLPLPREWHPRGQGSKSSCPYHRRRGRTARGTQVDKGKPRRYPSRIVERVPRCSRPQLRACCRGVPAGMARVRTP